NHVFEDTEGFHRASLAKRAALEQYAGDIRTSLLEAPEGGRAPDCRALELLRNVVVAQREWPGMAKKAAAFLADCASNPGGLTAEGPPRQVHLVFGDDRGNLPKETTLAVDGGDIIRLLHQAPPNSLVGFGRWMNRQLRRI